MSEIKTQQTVSKTTPRDRGKYTPPRDRRPVETLEDITAILESEPLPHEADTWVDLDKSITRLSRIHGACRSHGMVGMRLLVEALGRKSRAEQQEHQEEVSKLREQIRELRAELHKVNYSTGGWKYRLKYYLANFVDWHYGYSDDSAIWRAGERKMKFLAIVRAKAISTYGEAEFLDFLTEASDAIPDGYSYPKIGSLSDIATLSTAEYDKLTELLCINNKL